MIARTAVVFILFWASALPAAVAQNIMVPSFGGRVYADGRPANWIIEVRLEGEDSSIIATAHTGGSSEFSFRNLSLPTGAHYILVIKEPGYKELRYSLNFDDFRQDSSMQGIYYYSVIISLNIESIPTGEKVDQKIITGPKVIDMSQLKVQIPDQARREYNLALKCIEDGESEAAMAHLEKAVELAPQYYDALNKLGVEYLRTEQYSKAEVVLNRACALNPNDSLPLKNLGTLYFKEGEKLTQAAEVGPEAIQSYYRKAADVLEKALDLNPLDPRTNLYLGTALYRVGTLGRAESLLLNALALDGMMYEARLTLLNIYMHQERYKDALKQITVYLEENPNAPQRQQIEKLKIQIEDALNQ